jgi:hypothetical protein
MQCDLAPVRRAAMLDEVESLPGAEHEASVRERNRQLRRQQRGANMRRHIVGSFIGVAIAPRLLGGERAQEILEIGADLGRRILLDEQRSGGMAQIEGEKPRRHALRRDPAGDGCGDLVQSLPRRGDLQAVLCHAHEWFLER